MNRLIAETTIAPADSPEASFQPSGLELDSRKMQPEDVTISCLENVVPPFVEAELERLYGSLYSSLKKFEVYGVARGASTYVVRENGMVVAVFLFRLDRNKVQVLNEVINIDEKEMRRFAETIFSKFRFVSVISFKGIQTDVDKLPFPFQRINYSEDLVIALPGSPEKYLASLGNATRRNIKYYSNKIHRNFPSFKYKFYENDDDTEHHVRSILALRSTRGGGKAGSETHVNDAEIDRILAMLKACNGLVGIATIDGRVCAGQISYRVGNNEFASIIAYDHQYHSYCIGTICCYLTICECITRGDREFHFQWGRHEYKYRFLGIQRDLDNVHIYRSRIQLARHANLAVGSAYQGYLRQVKLWLLDPKNRDGLIPRLAIKLVHYLRKIA